MVPGKVLVAEDHPMFRDGLVILAQELGASDVLNAGDFESALGIARDNPDLSLITLDLQIPGTQGLDGLKTLRQEFMLIPIIVISMLEMGGNVRNVMDLGANGFISKSTPKDVMLEGMKKVLAGEIVVITNEPLSDIRLTPRQMDIVKLLGEGKSNKQIARDLKISDITVRDYLSEIMHLLDADNRTQVVVAARRKGLILD